MSANTEHTDGDHGHAVDRGDPAPEADPPADPEWSTVPEGDGTTVEVRWTDLRAMRDRIDDLEAENADLRGETERLRAKLDAAERRREATIERYERLLERAADPRLETPTGNPDEPVAGGTAADGRTGLFARVVRWFSR